ncbi:MAG: alanine racemase [Chloroflexota bacterium]
MTESQTAIRNSQFASAWAEIDLAAIAHNVQLLKRALTPPTRLMAVVKANAYGHGAVPVAQTALRNGAEWLGVARVAEGRELRDAQIAAPILVLGPIAPVEAEVAVQSRLRVAVASLTVARALSDAAQQHNLVTPVHLKIDTGMTRFGVPCDQAVAFARALQALPSLRLEGAFTHFASADDADLAFTQQQAERFARTVDELARANIPIMLRHAANSAGTLASDQFHFDLVRAGIAMYGVCPAEHLSLRDQLRPALSLKSRVALVRAVSAGTSIGYGRTFVSKRAIGVALVSIGYADGVRRALSNRGEVLIRGKRARILGRVSMDQIVVRADEVGAQEGDEVTLIGTQGDEQISAAEVAGWADTIPYEVLTGIGARVPRVYSQQ